MSNNKNGWYCHYTVSEKGIRALQVNEPYLVKGGSGGYPTKDKANEVFSKELDNHVDILIRKIKYHGMNKALRKRLIKYGNIEALKALDETERLLKALPNFNCEPNNKGITEVIFEDEE